MSDNTNENEKIIESDTPAENDKKAEKKAAKKEKKAADKAAKGEKKKLSKKVLKQGAFMTVTIVVVLVLTIAANIIVNILGNRVNLKLDLTTGGIFEVSEETIDYLGKITEDVDIVVMATENTLANGGTAWRQVAEVVKKYAQYSDKINVEFIDIVANPNYSARYNEIYKGTISEGNIVINSGDRIKVLTAYDIFEIENSYYSSTIKSSKAEQALTSAVMYVTDVNPMKVTFLTTPSAGDYSSIQSLVEANGYDIAEIDPTVEEIPQDSAFVILPAPLNDYSSAMIEKLDAYLYNDGALGKNLMYIASLQQNATPNLNAFLEEWGIKVGEGYVLDSNASNMQMVPLYGLGNYGYGLTSRLQEETYSAGLSSNLPILVPYSRPLTALYEDSNTRKVERLLSTADTAIVVPDDAESSSFDIEAQTKQTVDTVLVGSKYVFNDNNEQIWSKVLVCGSLLMFDQGLTGSNSFNNGDYFVSVFNNITGKSAGISIVSKDLTNPTIQLSETQAFGLRNIFMFGLPLLIAAVGVVVYVRRRNK